MAPEGYDRSHRLRDAGSIPVDGQDGPEIRLDSLG
jgi:hypothetical protein